MIGSASIGAVSSKGNGAFDMITQSVYVAIGKFLL